MLRHSWPFGHSHQATRPEPGPTMSGVTSSFFVGCHNDAISGFRSARDLPGWASRKWWRKAICLRSDSTRRSLLPSAAASHAGHPAPSVLEDTTACHTFRHVGHIHHALYELSASTSPGRTGSFRRSCHCSARSALKGVDWRGAASLRDPKIRFQILMPLLVGRACAR